MTRNILTDTWDDLNVVSGPRGLFTYGYNAFSSVYHTAFGMALAALLNVIPVSMIVIGFLNMEQCAVEPYLPKWLIWMGALLLVKYAVDTTLRIYKVCCAKEAPLSDIHHFGPLDWIFSGFITMCFLLGSYWLYGTFGRAQFTMSEYTDYCDILTYGSVFVIILLIYVILFALCCVFCVCCGVMCWKTKVDRERYQMANMVQAAVSSL
uniref:Uncharacterized protein n=1 Tax=Parascaris univalens TaxID=6257 RepID=A0A915AI74_PARUN